MILSSDWDYQQFFSPLLVAATIGTISPIVWWICTILQHNEITDHHEMVNWKFKCINRELRVDYSHQNHNNHGSRDHYQLHECLKHIAIWMSNVAKHIRVREACIRNTSENKNTYHDGGFHEMGLLDTDAPIVDGFYEAPCIQDHGPKSRQFQTKTNARRAAECRKIAI